MCCLGVSSLSVTDLGGGSYGATVCSSKAGILTLSATVNGEMVGLPATVAVDPAPLVSLVACTSVPLHCIAGISLLPFLGHSCA